MAIFRPTGGSSITWFEPPPFETITDPFSISAANKSLIKGSPKEELSCNFSLTSDLSIITTSMNFGGRAAATFLQGQQALSVDPRFANRFNATWVPNKLTLSFFNVTDADEGEYHCEVISFGSSVQTWIRRIKVSLLGPPSITEISGKTVTEGGNLTLKCLAVGKPAPSITWTRLSDNHTVTMPLIYISRYDAKDYRCTADNGVGTPAYKEISVNVQYPVELIGSPSFTIVTGGGVKNLTCPVDGNPPPSIMWYKGSEASGKNISSKELLSIKVKSGESVCFTCVASNPLQMSVNVTRCFIAQAYSPASTYPTRAPIPKSPPWTVIGILTGVFVCLVIVMIGLLAWWMRKKRKLRKDIIQGEMEHLEADRMDSGGRLE